LSARCGREKYPFSILVTLTNEQTCVRTGTHACIHTYIHACIHTHTYMHTYTYINTHTYIHTYIHTHTYMHAYIHTCIHTYIHTYMHAYIHTHINTYIHTFMHTYIHTYIHACQKTEADGSARSLLQYCQLPDKNTRDISSNIWNFSRKFKFFVRTYCTISRGTTVGKQWLDIYDQEYFRGSPDRRVLPRAYASNDHGEAQNPPVVRIFWNAFLLSSYIKNI